MSFMRLGTRIAVINDSGEILLSKRGDFGIWALPGGRVDSGELLHESAIREVREETGLEVEIERPIGLYYQQGRSRMNILYRAKPIGGDLFTASDETLDNRFFSPDAIPDDLFGRVYIDDAYTKKTHLHTIESSRWELLKLDLKLRWRWFQNLLAGRPEPKFTQFTINAVGLFFNSSHKEIWMVDGEIFRETSRGKEALPDLLVDKAVFEGVVWRWAGIWQDTKTDTIEFVFEDRGTVISNMFVALDDIPSGHDRRLAKQAKRQSTKIWTLTEE